MKLLFALLFFYNIATGQTVSKPVWPKGTVFFQTAKFKIYDSKTRKYGADIFKDASITIENADRETPSITLDVPDKYFIKEGALYSIDYKYQNIKQSITYCFVKEKKFVSTTFYFGSSIELPERIFISATDNIGLSNEKNISFLLYDFK